MLLTIVPGLVEVAATGLAAFTAAGIEQLAYSLTPEYADLFSLFGFTNHVSALPWVVPNL